MYCKKLNSNVLKYIAATFMFLDSTFYAFLPIGLLPSWVHLITRFVAPLFAFFLVEGFFHTRNRKKYALRLWLAAIIMQLGDYLSGIVLGSRFQINDNIFLSLALGFTIMLLFEKAKNEQNYKKLFYNFVAILISILMIVFSMVEIPLNDYSFIIEGGLQILLVVLSFYFFYGNRKKQVMLFLALNALILVIFGIDLPSGDLKIWFEQLSFNSDSFTFLFLPFLLFYNGEKGSSNKFNKYFFYGFYPLHLWLLHIIASQVIH